MWSKLSNDIAKALGGPDLGLVIALRKTTTSGPAYDPVTSYEYHRLTGMQSAIKQVDAGGTFIGVTGKRLLVAVEGVTPTKSDQVMIDGAEAFLDAPSDAAWDGVPVTSVEAVAPAGQAVLYKLFVNG
ncbi:hypothetical protein [Celeribacter sp. ULVN23_4]